MGAGVAKNLARRQAAVLVSTAFCRRQRGGVPTWHGSRSRAGAGMDLEEQAITAMLGRLSADDLAVLHQVYCANWRKPKPSIWMLPFLYAGCWHVLQGAKPDHQACV